MMLNKVILDSYDQYIDLKVMLYRLDVIKNRNIHMVEKLEEERSRIERLFAFTGLLTDWFRHYDSVLARSRNIERRKCAIQSKLETLKINVKSQWS